MITFADVIKDLSVSCPGKGRDKTDLEARRTNTALYRIVVAHMDGHKVQPLEDRVEFVGDCFKDDALLL